MEIRNNNQPVVDIPLYLLYLYRWRHKKKVHSQVYPSKIELEKILVFFIKNIFLTPKIKLKLIKYFKSILYNVM